MSEATPLATLLPPYLPHEDISIPLSILASNGITTDVDLIFASHSLPPHPSLPPKLYSLLRSIASSHLSAPSTSGVTLRSRAPKPRRISTALPSLDELFEKGGYPQGDLVEILGTPTSGRTILALYSTLLFLLNDPQSRAAYLATNRPFEVQRCSNILKQVLIPRARTGGRSFPVDSSKVGGARREMTDDEVMLEVLSRIAVSKRPKESGAALDMIAHEQESGGDTKLKLGVVVIDQIDDLLGGEALHSSKSHQGQANLIAFTRRLTALSKSPTSPFVVFLINTLTPNSTPTLKSPAFQINASNPQPPPITSLSYPSSFAPHGLSNPLNPNSGESWSNLIDLSLVLIRQDEVFSTRGVGDEVRGPRRREMVSLLEVAKNSRGFGGTGQLIGIKLENGIILSEI
ncbi:hypothetical protein JCM5353_008050 [Sporobolomyces roseus]